MLAQTDSLSPVQAAFRRAYERAAAHRLVAYRLSEGVYSVPSASGTGEYTVSHTGAGWSAWSCTCKAGSRGLACQHAATAAYAWRSHTGAVRPRTVPAAASVNPLVDLFN